MDVDEMQKKLATWADNDPSHRFFDIYHLLYEREWLARAYGAVKSNSGSSTAGVDGIDASTFEKNLWENLEDLAQELRNGSYDPKPVRRTYIPKGDGRKRPLGIPTIKDRIIQEALRMVLEPIYETDFSQYSYGFRPNRSTHDALNVVKIATRESSKYFWVIDADIKGFFDNVDHQTLEQITQKRLKDQKVRDLIWKFLKAGIMEEGKYRHSMVGTPQGGIVSPLLANIYLNELDQWVKQYTDRSRRQKRKYRKKGSGNWMYVRYADDFIMLTNGRKQDAEKMKNRLTEYLDTELDLTLSKKKTNITHVNDGLDFLGFHVERSENSKGEMQTQITIPKESIDDFREKIYVATNRSQMNMSESKKILALNALIRGWGNYYRHCWSAASTFNSLDHFIWKRMMHWIAGKHKTSVKKATKRLETDDKTRIKVGDQELVRLQDLETKPYRKKIFKEHPYLEKVSLEREKLPEERPWLGDEGNRAGFGDQRFKALERDDWTCQSCGKDLNGKVAEVHHRKPVKEFSNPKEANRLDNLETLCADCHKATHTK